MSDVDRLLAGECVHGKEPDCLECAMTRYLVVCTRRALAAIFPPRPR